MAVFGLSEFDVFANPVMDANGNLSYDATTAFQVDSVTYEYGLVDGVAYLASNVSGSVDCLPVSDVPPVKEVRAL